MLLLLFRFERKVDKKDDQILELHKSMTDVVKNNTEAFTKVNDALVSNTRATENLSTRIENVLMGRRN
jgi:hypothetical protein